MSEMVKRLKEKYGSTASRVYIPTIRRRDFVGDILLKSDLPPEDETIGMRITGYILPEGKTLDPDNPETPKSDN